PAGAAAGQRLGGAALWGLGHEPGQDGVRLGLPLQPLPLERLELLAADPVQGAVAGPAAPRAPERLGLPGDPGLGLGAAGQHAVEAGDLVPGAPGRLLLLLEGPLGALDG